MTEGSVHSLSSLQPALAITSGARGWRWRMEVICVLPSSGRILEGVGWWLTTKEKDKGEKVEARRPLPSVFSFRKSYVFSNFLFI